MQISFLNLQLKIWRSEKYSDWSNGSIFFDETVKMQVLTLKYAFHNPFLVTMRIVNGYSKCQSTVKLWVKEHVK